MTEIHTTGHPEEASQAENGNAKFIPMFLQLENGEGVDIRVPIGQRLREDTEDLFPSALFLDEKIIVEPELSSLRDRLTNHLDLVFSQNPESREAYAQMLENKGHNMVFYKGDFVYIYESYEESTVFTRMTADPLGTVLTQAISINKDNVSAAAITSEGQNLDSVKMATLVQTQSAIYFAKDVILSDLNPVTSSF